MPLRQRPPVHGSAKHDATVSKKRVIYVPVGREKDTSDTSYILTDGPRFFNKDGYDRVEAIYFEVVLQQLNEGTYTVYVELYNATDAVSISGAELSASLAQWAFFHTRTGDIKGNLPSGLKRYETRIKVEDGGSVVQRSLAMLVVVQSE